MSSPVTASCSPGLRAAHGHHSAHVLGVLHGSRADRHPTSGPLNCGASFHLQIASRMLNCGASFRPQIASRRLTEPTGFFVLFLQRKAFVWAFKVRDLLLHPKTTHTHTHTHKCHLVPWIHFRYRNRCRKPGSSQPLLFGEQQQQEIGSSGNFPQQPWRYKHFINSGKVS